MNKKIIDRNYGSIPHLSTSKLNQQADKKISIGQEKILTEKVRDKYDVIIVTEKIDGSNVGVYKKDDVLYPLTRSGYEAISSPFNQHHLFDIWVSHNQEKFLNLPCGWRVCGEWCIQSHGTIYDITNEPYFVAFDIFNENNKRLPYLEFKFFCFTNNISFANEIHFGDSIKVEEALNKITVKYGNPEIVEGLVYRCERKGEIDFLAKWVDSRKEDGKYMKDEIFNIGFDWEKI